MNALPVSRLLAVPLAAAALLLAGCGGSGGGADLSARPITMSRNTVVAGTMAVDPALPADPITVSLLADPAIRATIAADGTFTLRGLTAGNHTLVFTQRGEELPRVLLPGVAEDQQITLQLRQFADELVLTKEDRRGLGSAAVEFEGAIENALLVNPNGDSRFVIGSRAVLVRAGVTSIREGLAHRAVEQMTLGRRVQVRGATLASTDVIAFQVRLQEPDAAPYEKELTICHAPPGQPWRFKTLTIGSSAWPAHEAHNDAVGLCKP